MPQHTAVIDVRSIICRKENVRVQSPPLAEGLLPGLHKREQRSCAKCRHMVRELCRQPQFGRIFMSRSAANFPMTRYIWPTWSSVANINASDV